MALRCHCWASSGCKLWRRMVELMVNREGWLVRTLPASPASICSTSASRSACRRSTGVLNSSRYCSSRAGQTEAVRWRQEWRVAAAAAGRPLCLCFCRTSSSMASIRFFRSIDARHERTNRTTDEAAKNGTATCMAARNPSALPTVRSTDVAAIKGRLKPDGCTSPRMQVHF